MTTNSLYRSALRNTKHALRISYCAVLLLLTACASTATPTLFVPPSSPSETPTQAPILPAPVPVQPPTLVPTSAPIPSPAAELTASPTPACSASLRYLQDMNYPDGSIVAPGQSLEKQWQVENNGDCNWDSRYRLKLSDGFPALGAATEQALYPARAGSQAILTVTFTAPLDAGTYLTSWQAIDPQGNPFGDPVYMQIVVQP